MERDMGQVPSPVMNIRFISHKLLQEVLAGYQNEWRITPQLSLRGVVDEVEPGGKNNWRKKKERDFTCWWQVITWADPPHPLQVRSPRNETKWIRAASSFFGDFEEVQLRPSQAQKEENHEQI